MCGVAGLFSIHTSSLSGEYSEVLDRMLDEMHLRGPDGRGKTIYGPAGMVHTRLAIVDVDSRANQPMESDDWVLSYNGEIYNFLEVRKELCTRYEFKTTSDTEVLLLALQEWGIDEALKRCAGMFAFLAYNKRKNVFYAVRDRMGIKPLLMSVLDDGTFCFASTVTAIRKSFPTKEWRSFTPALASFFILGAPCTNTSVVEGIERIEPAHYIKCYGNGLVEKVKYWEPQFRPNFHMDDLVEIVQQHQISDVQSALFLSGGVDSTFLSYVTQDLDCFHLISPEMNYAQAVAKKLNREFVAVAPQLDEYEADVRKVIELHGEPLMSCGIPHSVSKAVASSGYKMAISANGADELFHGYFRTPYPEYSPASLPLFEPKTVKWFYKQLSHIFRDSRNFSIPEYSNFIPNLSEIGIEILKSLPLTENFSPSANHRWIELMTYVLFDLNPTLDAASMANSVEVRVPFLDHRLVEGVLSWPAEKIVTPKYGRKAPLKQYMEKDFPVTFFNRPKLGFSISSDKLSDISQLGEAALINYQKNNFLKVSKETRFNEFDRDMIYLGSSCYAHRVWEELFSA